MSISPLRMLGWDVNRDRADRLAYTKYYDDTRFFRQQSPEKVTAEDEVVYNRFTFVAPVAKFRMAITSAKMPTHDTIRWYVIQPLEYLKSSEAVRPVKVAVKVPTVTHDGWGLDRVRPIFIRTGGGWIKDEDFIKKLAAQQHRRTIQAAKVFTGQRDISDVSDAERLMRLVMDERIGRERLASAKPIKEWDDVPNELRLMIYKFAVGPIEKLRPYRYVRWPYIPSGSSPQWTFSLHEAPRVRNMFHLCKDVTVELHKYMYGEGNFWFSMVEYLNQFLVRTPEATLQLIRSMELELDPEPILNLFGGPHMWHDNRATESSTINTFRRLTALHLKQLTIRTPHPSRLRAFAAPMRGGCHFRIALMIVKTVKEGVSQFLTPPKVTFKTYGEFTPEQMTKLKDVEMCPEDVSFSELAGVQVDVDGVMQG